MLGVLLVSSLQESDYKKEERKHAPGTRGGTEEPVLNCFSVRLEIE